MIREEGLTSGQKACIGALIPALLFLPVVLTLAVMQSNTALMELLVARFDDELVRLFWGLVFVSLVALFGLISATVSRRRSEARRGQFQGHTY